MSRALASPPPMSCAKADTPRNALRKAAMPGKDDGRIPRDEALAIAREALRQGDRAAAVVKAMLLERGFEYTDSKMSTASESLLADDIVHFARRTRTL